MARIHYREQDLQIRCVKWFRITYPAFASLMFHPKNEEAGGRTRAAIAKAEGVQAGVADLILLVPSQYHHALAIEMKDKKTGRKSKSQKLWERYFTAASGKYVTIKTFEDFRDEVTKYMDSVDYIVHGGVEDLHEDIEQEMKAEAKRELAKLLDKQDFK